MRRYILPPAMAGEVTSDAPESDTFPSSSNFSGVALIMVRRPALPIVNNLPSARTGEPYSTKGLPLNSPFSSHKAVPSPPSLVQVK